MKSVKLVNPVPRRGNWKNDGRTEEGMKEGRIEEGREEMIEEGSSEGMILEGGEEGEGLIIEIMIEGTEGIIQTEIIIGIFVFLCG